MLILIWRYSRALIHYELEYLLYNCTHETIDNMADFTKIQSSSDLSYGLSLVEFLIVCLSRKTMIAMCINVA